MAGGRPTRTGQSLILVVDKNPLGIGSLVAALPPSVETVVTSSVAEALQLGDRGVFDLIIVGVPSNGSERMLVLADVRVAFPGIPVVALAENDDESERLAILAAGAVECRSRNKTTAPEFASLIGRLLDTTNPRGEIERRAAHVEQVLDAVGEGIIVQSSTGRVVLATERALEILRVARTDLVAKDLAQVGIELRSAAGRVLTREEYPAAIAMRSRGPVPPVLLQMRRGDGELRWIEATTSPLHRAEEVRAYAVVTSLRDVTEAQAAQQAMVGAERRERLLLEHSGDGYILLDADGRIVESSDLVERLWEREALIGRPLRDLAVLDDRDALIKVIDDVSANKASPLRIQARVLDRQGAIRWIELTLTNRLDEPTLVGVVVNVRDVTERKRAEDAAMRLSAVLDSLDDAIFAETLDGVITSWNGAAERMFGYSAYEAVGSSALIITPAERLEGALEVRERILQRKRVALEKTQRRRKDGVDVEVNLTVSPLFDAEGLLIGSSTTVHGPGVAAPIAQPAAQASERNRLGFEFAAIGMATLSAHGEFVLANPALCEMLGRQESELAGHRLTEFLHPGDLAAQGYEAGLEGDPARFRGERNFVRPDGAIVNAEVDVTEVRAENGEMSYFCQIRDVTGARRSEAELEHHALHDPLTGLANRAMLAARLDLATARNRREQSLSALVGVDLDHFQLVNDALGHPSGDRLLRDIATRLLGACEPTDLVTRSGSDEFIVLRDYVRDTAGADGLAQAIVETLSQPFIVDDQPVYVTASCGVAVIDGRYAVDDAMRAVDAAVHYARELGGDQVARFDDQMGAEMERRFDLEREIRFALERDELRVYYQPILKVATAELVGVEALVRWQHPTRGLLGADEFIPVAERSGLIASIGAFVLESALRQVVEWRKSLPRCERLWVSVNFSSRQLLLSNPVSTCLWALAAAGAPADALRIELTETAVMKEVDTSIQRLSDLRAIGIRVAIDDFGTGHSSLSYLNKLPVGSLKVDHSFVEAMGTEGSEAIVDTIVNLAKALDLELCVEGVESVDQRVALHRLGCEYGQGYLWSAPLSAKEFESWVTRVFTARPV
jgi:diguanylate cyclase (GGDEF)-like protein/PAS domain S-box-containing protein